MAAVKSTVESLPDIVNQPNTGAMIVNQPNTGAISMEKDEIRLNVLQKLGKKNRSEEQNKEYNKLMQRKRRGNQSVESKQKMIIQNLHYKRSLRSQMTVQEKEIEETKKKLRMKKSRKNKSEAEKEMEREASKIGMQKT